MKRRKRITGAALACLMAFLSAGTGVESVYAAENPETGTVQDAFAERVQKNFAEPEMKHKLYARWWLAEGSHTDETLKESIHELYEAGYGGVEFVTLDESQYLENETYAWGSEEWIHDTHVILEECRKLGMSVSMTSGTNWATANLISIQPDEEAAAQELGYVTVQTEVNEEGKAQYRGELPLCELPGNVSRQRLVKVVAARITERETVKQQGMFGASSEIQTGKIDMDSLTDVTELAMDAGNDGTYWIDYTGPDDGAYDLIAFYQYGTGEQQRPAVSPSYTINYLSRQGAEALIEYWDSNVLTQEVQSLIDGIDECSLYMDSLECNTHGKNTTGLFWCRDMLEQFEQRRGYALDEVLPLLVSGNGRNGVFGSGFSYIYEPADEEDQAYVDNLRSDFYQTMTELYTENCLEVLTDWLHSKNMTLRAENSYGVTFEISQPVQALDYVETESMEFGNELDAYRGQAGAAHLFDKRYSSETGAWVSSNYRFNNEYYRQIFYMQYAAGIQKTITHGYSSEYGPEGRVKWPGYEGMGDVWSERFNKRQPAALDYEALNLHLSRLQKVLEQGAPQMDIAMLRTDYGFNNQLTPGGLMNFVKEGVYGNKTHNQDAYYWRDLELQNAGYTYDYFSPYLLTQDSVQSRDGLLNPDGAAYQALVIMQEELPYEAAVRMLEWAKDGLPVVFVNHVEELVDNSGKPKVNEEAGSTTGSNDKMDGALQEIVAEMKALDCVKTVESTADACEALMELGVYPRAWQVQPNSKILPVMRHAEDADYLYLYHYMYEDEEAYIGQISLDGNYEAYRLDTWSGKVTAENSACEENRTVLDVELAPGETAVYVLKKSDGISEEPKAKEKSTVLEEIALEDWELTVDSYEEGEKLARTEVNEETGTETTEVTYTTSHRQIDAGRQEELVSWKNIEAIGETVSGAGMYTTSFEVPEEWDSKNSTAVFEAESFSGGTAAVWVNDIPVPVNMDSGAADITEMVKPGENTIVVRVTSSLCNVMREIGYESGWNIVTPESNDYGMTGETKIVIESR